MSRIGLAAVAILLLAQSAFVASDQLLDFEARADAILSMAGADVLAGYLGVSFHF